MNKTKLQDINKKPDEQTFFSKCKEIVISKERIVELASLSVLALVLVVVSFGISKLPQQDLQFEFAPTIGGQRIEIFSNKHNLFLLIFFQVMLLALVYKFVIPALSNKFINKDEVHEKIDYKEYSKDILKSIAISFGIGFFMTISTCAINTFQTMDLSNASSLIPIIILGISSFFLALLTVKQFEEESQEASKEETTSEINIVTISNTSIKDFASVI
jgi:hypothetical protein